MYRLDGINIDKEPEFLDKVSLAGNCFQNFLSSSNYQMERSMRSLFGERRQLVGRMPYPLKPGMRLYIEQQECVNCHELI